MSTSTSHPFGASGSAINRTLSRIGNACWRLGFLGVLGLFEHLQWLWQPLELAQVFNALFLLFLAPPILGTAQYMWKYTRSESEQAEANTDDDPTDWMTTGYEPHPLKLLQTLVFMIHPNTVVRGTAQLFGSLVVFVRYRGHLPTPAEYETTVDYTLPFRGEWTVHSGSPDPDYSHSWFPVQQRYAYDFVKTDEHGQTHDGTGGPESFYCFDEPVTAPADGTVIRSPDGHRDHHRTTGWLDPLQYRLAGNCVVIKHAPAEYSFLGHLKQGSVCVSEGDTVSRGEEIGRCGHSGNSTEPHLHFQVQDNPRFYLSSSLPLQFTEIAVEGRDGDTESRERAYIHCGQVVHNHVRGFSSGSELNR
ncbi:peptidase M23 [Haloferax larsenii JCM 13917]|nr:peptidase M23 [Haloferax larsenii JCM 13917]